MGGVSSSPHQRNGRAHHAANAADAVEKRRRVVVSGGGDAVHCGVRQTPRRHRQNRRTVALVGSPHARAGKTHQNPRRASHCHQHGALSFVCAVLARFSVTCSHTLVRPSQVAHRFFAPVIHHGAWMLGNFALDAHNREFIRELGGMLAIAEGMDPHLEHPEVQRYCMQALAMLCTDDAAAKIKARDLELIEAVTRGINAHLNNPRVVDAGLQALMRFAENNAANTGYLGKEGALQLVTTCMRAHRKDAGVQVAASMFILAVCIENEDNKILAGTHDGVELLHTAMSAHLNDAVTMRYVVNTMKCLCQFNEPNFEQARDLDVVEDLILVRASHEDQLVVRLPPPPLLVLGGCMNGRKVHSKG